MCVDFTDPNKACLNNSFHLQKIDKIVDSTVDFEFLSSLDINSGYHQIPMYLKDEEKTSFIIEERTFCYKANLFSFEKHKDYLPADGQQIIQTPNREEHGSLCG
jgi:hypothetical protein